MLDNFSKNSHVLPFKYEPCQYLNLIHHLTSPENRRLLEYNCNHPMGVANCTTNTSTDNLIATRGQF